MTLEFITPSWPAPKNIKAFTTTRIGGFSKSPYDTFNTANHVGDDPDAVAKNRKLLRETLHLPSEPTWLNQVHGVEVIQANQQTTPVTADASFTQKPGVVCVAQTADCLPLLVCDRAGTTVAAIHAGWKGLAAGVIEATINTLKIPAQELLVWLGPAMGPQSFEVKEDVLAAFTTVDPKAELAFKPINSTQWLANIYLLAKQRLNNLGITHIYGEELCTYNDKERFFSFRRDKDTGRMASLIWME